MDKETAEAFDRDCEALYARYSSLTNDEWLEAIDALLVKYEHIPYDGPIGDVVEPWKFTPEAREAWEKKYG